MRENCFSIFMNNQRLSIQFTFGSNKFKLPNVDIIDLQSAICNVELIILLKFHHLSANC